MKNLWGVVILAMLAGAAWGQQTVLVHDNDTASAIGKWYSVLDSYPMPLRTLIACRKKESKCLLVNVPEGSEPAERTVSHPLVEC